MSLPFDSYTGQDLKKGVLFICFLLLTILVFFYVSESGWLDILTNQEKIKLLIEQAGIFAPVAIIVIIASAIIISPIPSAPVALVSGALYGHTFGTIYVVLGAISGALMAFLIARKLGYEYVNRKFYPHLPGKIIGSQNTLMFIVFISRLAPFISFDVISYAAGLTSLSLGRFFVATLFGVIPISFILAHLGSEMMLAESQSIAISILLLGLITAVPILINRLMKNKKLQD